MKQHNSIEKIIPEQNINLTLYQNIALKAELLLLSNFKHTVKVIDFTFAECNP